MKKVPDNWTAFFDVHNSAKRVAFMLEGAKNANNEGYDGEAKRLLNKAREEAKSVIAQINHLDPEEVKS